MASAIDDISPTATPVSWQAAFWTIIPLAISTMTQPCGKVCGLPSRTRTWLRSSPIVCLADVLSIFIRLFVTCIGNRISPRSSMLLLLDMRFSDAESEENGESTFREVEKLTALRWLFFLVGTLPPAIKLAAMEGVLWTKSIGMALLASFLFIEIFIVVGGWVERRGIELEDIPTNPRLAAALLHIERGIVILSLMLHALLISWVHYKVYIQDKSVSAKPAMSIFFASLGGFLILVLLGKTLFFAYPARFLVFKRTALCLATVSLIYTVYKVHVGMMTAFMVFWTFSGIAIISVFGIMPFLVIFRSLGRGLLILPGDDIDFVGSFAFSFFVWSLAYLILGYGIIYDQSNTVLPSWTGVFG